jgi:repressor LexA
MERLTEKQEKVLQFIVRFVRENNISPTVREIMKGMGLSSPRPVQDHLKILQRKGYLSVKNSISRGIRLSRQLMDIPVLGRVGAGKVIAETDIQGYIDLNNIITGSHELFGLRVKGNSMMGAGIHDGDIVVVRKQPVAEPGDLVVVVKDGESLVRWMRKDEGGFSLQADALEGKYPVEALTDEHTIFGKVAFLLRNYAYQLINTYG